MTELEILAELKIAYRQLEDIFDNEDMQGINRKELIKAIQILQEQYRNVYKEVDTKELYYKKDIMIPDEIYYDYLLKDEDNEKEYIPYADLFEEQKWWEDYDFLVK